MRVCSECGQPTVGAPAEIRALIDGLDFPRRERLALNRLLESWPRMVPTDALVEAMYDAVGDDPDQPEAIVHCHISKARSKLKAHGYTIKNRRFQGYQIAPFEAGDRP